MCCHIILKKQTKKIQNNPLRKQLKIGNQQKLFENHNIVIDMYLEF